MSSKRTVIQLFAGFTLLVGIVLIIMAFLNIRMKRLQDVRGMQDIRPGDVFCVSEPRFFLPWITTNVGNGNVNMNLNDLEKDIDRTIEDEFVTSTKAVALMWTCLTSGFVLVVFSFCTLVYIS